MVEDFADVPLNDPFCCNFIKIALKFFDNDSMDNEQLLVWVNIGSGNGLLPDGTKPLPDLMLTYHQRVQWPSTEGNFTGDTSAINH